MLDKFRGCLLGLALGDALGAPYEGMTGPIIFDLEKVLSSGTLSFTDDTMMALCIARSIIAKKCFDPKDIAENYLKWFLSGDLRGIGITVYKALSNYLRSRDWKACGIIDFWAAGNGVAMRVAPIALYDIYSTEHVLYEHVRLDGWITHKNELAISGAFAVALAIRKAADGGKKEDVLTYVKTKLEEFGIINRVYDSIMKVIDLLDKNVADHEAFKILGTSGYVVHTVSSALFAFMHYDNYMDSVVSVIKAGDDTDTNAAVTGAIAGIYYGYNQLPSHLIERLEDYQDILRITDHLYDIVKKS